MCKVIGLLLLLWCPLAGAQTIDRPCEPAQEKEVQTGGLRGPVRTVRSFKSRSVKDQKTGVLTNLAPELEEEASYDREGNQISFRNVNYLVEPAGNSPYEAVVEYVCDSSNRIVELKHKRVKSSSFEKTSQNDDRKARDRAAGDYPADGILERQETYSYDQNGNLIEAIAKQHIPPKYFLPKRYDVYVTTKTKYEYDQNRNKTREIFYSPDGSLYSTWMFTYDAENRLIKETHVDKVGRSETQHTYQYNSKGQVVEEKDFNNLCTYHSGEMCEATVDSGDGMFYYHTKTVYEYDAIGNWVVQKEFSMGGENSTGRYEPGEVLTRRISYYKK